MQLSPKRLTDILGLWSARHGSLQDSLALSFQEAIEQGNLQPGTRLPSERQLARVLAISRTTVVATFNRLRSTGWIESRTGSGTWVSRSRAGRIRAESHALNLASSPLINILQAAEAGAIDFVTSSPYPLTDLITPLLDEISEYAARLIGQREYLPFGLPQLRDVVAHCFSVTGTPTSRDEVLITTGGQQAISLVCNLLLQRGDNVLVESPTYYGALEAIRVTGARMAAVPLDDRGQHPATLLMQRAATVGARMIYTTPTGQNPTGSVMPDHARAELAQGSSKYGVVLVEDEVLADLLLVGRRQRSIAAFSPNANVLTIGSISKLIWPSLRVGWIRGPRPLIARLAGLKIGSDLGSALLPQMLAVSLLEKIEDARAMRRKELLPKRNLLTRLINEHLPAATFTIPKAGLCFWIRLPGIDSQLLAQITLRRGLALGQGNFFSVDETHGEYIRIPFVLGQDLLERGIVTIAESIDELNKGHRVATADRIALI
jgi:DNA-binding transcriptional MocR family regulator